MLKFEKKGEKSRVGFPRISRLNLLISEAVRHQLSEKLEQPGTSITLDMDGIRFVDSAGFSMLLDMLNLARSAQGEFILANVHDEVIELISLMELDDQLKVAA